LEFRRVLFRSQVPGLAYAFGRADRFHGDTMADVERDPQPFRVAQFLPQAQRLIEVLHVVAGFGLQREAHPGALRPVQHGGHPVEQTSPRGPVVELRRRHTRPERHALRPQVRGDLSGPTQEVHPGSGLVGPQGRLTLAPRVEQETRAGLHHDAEPQFGQSRRDTTGLCRHVVGERVQMRVIQRQRHSRVTEIGDDGQGVVEPVVGETVGAVTESQSAHVGLTFLASRRANGRTVTRNAAERTAPYRAATVACSGTMPWIPAFVAWRACRADGSRSAAYWAPPTELA